MLIPFGIFSASAVGSDYELIETQILGSTTATVTFSSLGTYSSIYKHLQFRYTSRTNRAGDTNDRVYLAFNGDTGANVFTHTLFGDGTSVGSNFGFGGGNELMLLENASPGNTATASAFGAGVVDILDSYSTTKNKTIRAFYGKATASNRIALNSGFWNNTAALTQVRFSAIGSFVAGSRFSLYGIKG
jgi:hypothetical protein